ncbi:MAG: helix-hairpin-helix domain-containing protein [Cyanobacteria bacterium]|nr:helix-hairpin-helix domain-containing protein [Cyanobacteriota bacterium]MDA1020487.1 helix-hairpin-helix domain-containing protein [Cyanobacteriota bacterium]
MPKNDVRWDSESSMKKLALWILLFGITFSIGIYFSRDYKFEHYMIEPKSDLVKAYKINLNLADWREYENLPGIGPTLAQRIVDDRAANGRFNAIEELKRVSGIGEVKYQVLSEFITLEVQ